MRLKTLLLGGMLLALAGCNLAPDYHPPETSVPDTYKEAGPWQPAQPSDAALMKA